MPVVSNTSPLLNLAVIGRLSLIREQFGSVIIPSVVQDELQLDSSLPGAGELRKALADRVLIVDADADRSDVQRSLSLALDVGEAAAIALALSRKAEWVLLDDLDARKAATTLGLRVTGVIGILLRAKQMGSVDCVGTDIVKLRDKAGFRLSDQLVATTLKATGESELESPSA